MASAKQTDHSLRLNILGVNVNPLLFSDAVQKIMLLTEKNGAHHVVTVNPEFIMHALKDLEFRRILNRAEIATADGFGLRLAAKYLSIKVTWIPIVREVQAFCQGIVIAVQALFNRNLFQEIPEVVTGTDLVTALAAESALKAKSIYLVDRPGGLGDNTASEAANVLQKQFPGLKVVGAETADPGDKSLIKRIARAKPDLLFIAFGFPLQEQFLAKNRNLLKAKVSIGVGGAFDYIAGRRARPPHLLRGKFEWLWRLIIPSGHSLQEYGRRARRIFTAFLLFPIAVFFWKVRWGAGTGPIRSLALDFGGVTNQNGVEQILRRAWQIVPLHQLPVLVLFYFRYIPELERGGIPEDEIWKKFSGYFGTERDLAQLRTRILDGFSPNKPIWDLVRLLHDNRSIELAMLTNNIQAWMDIWEKRYRLSKYFSTIVASCDVGKRKPNPEIFRILIDRLSVSPEEIVYVDDHTRNVLQARRLGLRAIRCSDPALCVKMLTNILPTLT